MLTFIQVLRILGIIGMVFLGILLVLMAFFALVVFSQPDLVDEIMFDISVWAPQYAAIFSPASIFGIVMLMLSSFVAGIISLVSMGQLLKRKTKFLRVYEISVIIMLVGFLVYDFTLLATGSPMFMQQLVSTLFAAGICVLWFLYYVRSVRVRTYLGTDEYIKQSIFLRNVTPPQPAVPDAQSSQPNSYY